MTFKCISLQLYYAKTNWGFPIFSFCDGIFNLNRIFCPGNCLSPTLTVKRQRLYRCLKLTLCFFFFLFLFFFCNITLDLKTWNHWSQVQLCHWLQQSQSFPPTDPCPEQMKRRQLHILGLCIPGRGSTLPWKPGALSPCSFTVISHLIAAGVPQARPFCPQPTSSTCRHLSPCSLAPCSLFHERAFRQICPWTPSLHRHGRGQRTKRWRDGQEYVTAAQLKSPEPGMKLTPKPHFGQNINKEQAAAYLDLEVQLIFVG